MYQPPPLLADPGEPGLGAGGAVRLAACHGALGPLQSHGEWDEVANLVTYVQNKPKEKVLMKAICYYVI